MFKYQMEPTFAVGVSFFAGVCFLAVLPFFAGVLLVGGRPLPLRTAGFSSFSCSSSSSPSLSSSSSSMTSSSSEEVLLSDDELKMFSLN